LVQLHEGTKVSVEDQVEQWVKVRLANGTVGWLTQNDLRRIAF
jgi:SH3-like domain-containing protein